MHSDPAGFVALLLVSVPVFLALTWVHRQSRRRAIHATDDLVVAGLLRERKQRELELVRDSVQEQLVAVRRCEHLIYGRMPDSDHPELLRNAVSAPKAEEILANFLKHSQSVDERLEEQQADLEQQLDAKRDRIRAQNRRFRVLDRFLAFASWIVRFWLILSVLYALTDLAFGPVS